MWRDLRWSIGRPGGIRRIRSHQFMGMCVWRQQSPGGGVAIERFPPPRPVFTRKRLVALPVCEAVVMVCAVMPLRGRALENMRVKTIAEFSFDQKFGTVDDVPAAVQWLDGKRVALVGMM